MRQENACKNKEKCKYQSAFDKKKYSAYVIVSSNFSKAKAPSDIFFLKEQS